MNGLTAVFAAVASFGITAVFGLWLIPVLHKLKYGQTILDIGPSWHKSKEGTPTMGGLMFIAGSLIAIALSFGIARLLDSGRLFAELGQSYRVTPFLAGLAFSLCMAFIGFFDDYIKVVKKRNLGLTARQKSFLQLLAATGYLTSLRLGGMTTTTLPFFGAVDVTRGWGLLFWPIALIFVYGFTNAVNLTDGIDGLASAVTLVVGAFFLLASGLLSRALANLTASALVGACMGFLVWNLHPARVFMGDTGSMFLGGMVVALSFSIDRPVLLFFAGIVYLCEALSVVIQVTYYKRTKKRLFKMSPIHHHFELSGWSENKIVIIFSLVALLGCAIAILPVAFGF